MKSHHLLFNLYFCLFAGLLCAGCQTTKEEEKKATTLQLHLQTNPTDEAHTAEISIYRRQPILLYVQKEPFLQEMDVARAAVVPAYGGYSIKIQLTKHGSWILENMTASYKGKRIAIRAQFGEDRWLAAPVIREHISDGTLTFAPDATYEEAQRIVEGLNNIAAEVAKKSEF